MRWQHEKQVCWTSADMARLVAEQEAQTRRHRLLGHWCLAGAFAAALAAILYPLVDVLAH